MALQKYHVSFFQTSLFIYIIRKNVKTLIVWLKWTNIDIKTE